MMKKLIFISILLPLIVSGQVKNESNNIHWLELNQAEILSAKDNRICFFSSIEIIVIFARK